MKVYVIVYTIVLVLYQTLGPTESRSIKENSKITDESSSVVEENTNDVEKDSNVGKGNRLFGFFQPDYSNEVKPTRKPYEDRLSLIHSILRAKIDKMANESEHLVHKGAGLMLHSGELVGKHVSKFIRKFGHKVVDMVVKVHEWEEWKKELLDALSNKNSHEWYSNEIFKLYDKVYNPLNYFNHFKQSGENRVEKFSDENFEEFLESHRHLFKDFDPQDFDMEEEELISEIDMIEEEMEHKAEESEEDLLEKEERQDY